MLCKSMGPVLRQSRGVMVVFGLMTALSQGLLTGPLNRRWGEAIVIQGALVATAVGYLAISLAGTFTAFLLAIGLFTMVIALLAPAVSAMTSRQTTLEQGLTMGLSNAAQSLGRIAGPLLGGIVFDIYIEYPNYVGAAVMLVGFLISLFTIARKEVKAEETLGPCYNWGLRRL
jgi:DHA1 family multidrug resistance protein-like MFS transporter